MKKISRSLLLILSVLFVVCCIGLATARESIKLADKIAFLKDGDVWVADRDGRNMKRLTDTKEKIYKFLFSPDLGHLAFSRIVKYVDETGSKGEENVLQQAVLSTTIMSIKSGKILKEVLPPETSWIYPARWLPEGRLLFYLASGFDVAGFFEYDIGKMEQRDLDYRKGDQLAEADFHYGGSLMAYVEHDVTGESTVVQLHLIDLQTNRDRIVTSRKSILEPRISHDKNRIAFLEVEEDGEGRSFDRLWIYDIRNDSQESICRRPARAKRRYVNGLSWSLDDKYIAMAYSPEALVLNVRDTTEVHNINGKVYEWSGDDTILYTRANDIYLYELDKRESRLLIKDASDPVFLMKVKGNR